MPGIPTTHGEKADNTAESTAQSRQAALRRWDLEGKSPLRVLRRVLFSSGRR